MSIEEGIYALLRADADVTAVVGERIYPVILPQNGPLPAATYRRAGRAPRDRTLDDEGFTSVVLELTTWHGDYATAKRAGDVMAHVLDGYSGPLDDHTACDIMLYTDEDVYDAQLLVFGLQQSYTITVEHQEG
jgi:Protein of unknown function (DUF3168)